MGAFCITQQQTPLHCAKQAAFSSSVHERSSFMLIDLQELACLI